MQLSIFTSLFLSFSSLLTSINLMSPQIKSIRVSLLIYTVQHLLDTRIHPIKIFTMPGHRVPFSDLAVINQNFICPSCGWIACDAEQTVCGHLYCHTCLVDKRRYFIAKYYILLTIEISV